MQRLKKPCASSFLTDNFPPETNAPASRTFEHTSRWVKLGHEVRVITGAPNFPQGKVYPGYRNAWYQAPRPNFSPTAPPGYCPCFGGGPLSLNCAICGRPPSRQWAPCSAAWHTRPGKAGTISLSPRRRHRARHLCVQSGSGPARHPYLQAGLPVLARINPGNDLAELIDREGVGRVCADDSVDTLQRLALELADDRTGREPTAAHCRALFARLFSPVAAVQQIVAALA